jgi:hypothetical protein
MARVAIIVVPLLYLSAPPALSASECGQSSIVAASHVRLARASHNSMDGAANDDNCRAYFKQFVEAVTARQTAAKCQDGLERQRAIEILDAEIKTFNDRIAERSCEQ